MSESQTMPVALNCAQIWGGIRGDALESESRALRAALFSKACDGGRGGDIYYLSVCNADLQTRIALVDVMGHGEKVSLTSQWLYESLQRNMDQGNNAEILTELNRLACEFGFEAFSTAVVAAYYAGNSTLYFAYAGHHAILHQTAGSSAWVPVEPAEDTAHDFGSHDFDSHGLLLGVDPDAGYGQGAKEVHAGDRLLFYTDGLIEAPNEAGELFGQAGLEQALRGTESLSIGELRDHVLTALKQHTGNDLTHDDVTFMAIEVLPT